MIPTVGNLIITTISMTIIILIIALIILGKTLRHHGVNYSFHDNFLITVIFIVTIRFNIITTTATIATSGTILLH